MSASRRKFRIFSLEGGILAFSLFALSTGVMRGDLLSIFWGGMCALGLVALHFIRRKDWAQHWAQMDEKTGRRE
jgi:hypothetical protein